MIANPMNVWLFSRHLKRPVVTFRQSPVRGGCVMPEDISPAVWTRRILPMMLVKICRWAKAKDMTDFVFAMDYCFLILI
jgi:hypothetical protein